MNQIITTENKPIKMWINHIEDGALAQAKNLANLPFIVSHVAIMPDCHQGYGMPIGAVIATEGIIIPNAVGVDVGCGVCAVKTTLTELVISDLKAIMNIIRKTIPVGFKHQIQYQDDSIMPTINYYRGIVIKEHNSALKQVGTLGGGNHFIEFQKGDDGYIWFMIHSGSRNIGLKVATHYNNIAKKLNEKWFSQIPKKYDLAFLPVDDEAGKHYITEMKFCIGFALVNRQLMVKRIKEAILDIIPSQFDDTIDVAHNYAQLEHHFNKNVWVHRKGATMAKDGQVGIIPGSQGTPSYIVTGKGNPLSFHSCSHGAGRKLGRNQARKHLNFDIEKKYLDDLNIVHSLRSENHLDEAPGSYKDITEVMDQQSELIDIKVELQPLGVIKG